jgi:hypothetical protein
MATASPALMTPIPRVRESQIRLADRRPSYSSIRPPIRSQNARVFSTKPSGMSAASPPTRKALVVSRAPVVISRMFRMSSRSRKQ